MSTSAATSSSQPKSSSTSNTTTTTTSTSSPSSSSSSSSSSPSSSSWPRVRHFLGGYVSGCALVMVGHPFDLVKVRLQTSNRFKGAADCVLQTIRHEGIWALYKGVSPPLLATGSINALLFGMQGWAVAAMKPYNGHMSSAVQSGQAAIISGFFISFVVTPMEGVKSRLQVQYGRSGPAAASTTAAAASTAAAATQAATPQFNGPISCISYLYRTGGVAALYRGWLPVVFCRMSNYAYFGAYEAWKAAYTRVFGSVDKKGQMFAGGMAGISYWLSCYPMDVIKARMMASDIHDPAPRISSIAKHIHQQQGIKGFFKGFTPCIARAFPANAAAFLAFEWAMSKLPEKSPF